MAFVRLLCLPSTSQLSTQRLLLLSQTTPLSSLPKLSHLSSHSQSTCPVSLSSLSRKLYIKTQKPHYFAFSAFSSTQAQATTTSPSEVEQSETIPEEEEEEEEEVEVEVEVEASKTRVLAQNVPWTSTVDDIRSLFEKYGTVVDVELTMYNKTRNRGLAFVTMGSHEEALAALNNMELLEFEGRTLKLNWARPKKKKPPPAVQRKPAPIHNLFVANLSYKARAKDLKEFFNSENSNVVSAEVIFHDNPRRSSGYGFVSFNTKEEAEAAITAFQGKEFMGRPIRVARSRRFLRQQTRENIQSENSSIELSPSTEQFEKADVA